MTGCGSAPRNWEATASARGQAAAGERALTTEPRAATQEADQRPAYKVKRLRTSRTMNVGDWSLVDWAQDFKVMEIPAGRAPSLQWKKIRDYDPKPVKVGQFGIKVYMGWDDRNWYLAFQAADTAIRAVSRTSLEPYGGDCVEVYFAGAELKSESDIHGLLSTGAGRQRAFLRLTVPAVSLDATDVYLSDWRTDPALFEEALKAGFAVSVWTEGRRWSAEVRIPLDAFKTSVRKRIESGEPLRAALTYLNYDGKPAERSNLNISGFRPDNVFCLDPDERSVNVPRYMRTIIFER